MKSSKFVCVIMAIALVFAMTVIGCGGEDDYLESFVIYFNTNGGNGSIPSITAKKGESITLPDGSQMTKPGYIFIGWNTSYDGTGTDYKAGSSYTVTGDVSGDIYFFAKWYAIGGEAYPFSLTAGVWTGGSITASTANKEVWYSFDVTSGTIYYIWWNDGNGGNDVKTLDVKVSASYSNNQSIFTDIDSAWTTPQSFTAGSNGTVKLKVSAVTAANVGTFEIVYNTANSKPSVPAIYTVTFSANGGDGTVPPAQKVYSGSIITLPSGAGLSQTGYSFSGWEDASRNYNAFASYTVTGNTSFLARWTRVGTESNPIKLTERVWVDGQNPNITDGIWYSFTAARSTTYYIFFDDQNNSTNTLNGHVSVFLPNSSTPTTLTHSSTSYGSFDTGSSGTVKIRVRPMNSGNRGTYSIAFSTGSFRPAK
jgi:hypothetical protein